jgi:ribosomal protein L32
MPDTPADRKRRQRARDRGELPALPVCSCGKTIRGDRLLCSRCWLKTRDGREWQRLRLQSWRVKDRA